MASRRDRRTFAGVIGAWAGGGTAAGWMVDTAFGGHAPLFVVAVPVALCTVVGLRMGLRARARS